MNTPESTKQLFSPKFPLFSTLRTKLFIALIAIVIAISVGVFIMSQTWMRLYHEEVEQRLNADIAMYIVQEYELIEKEKNQPIHEVVKSLAHLSMIINPILEVYLLDPQGSIMAHALPTESLQTDRVPLGAIKDFIDGTKEFPLRNVDPRSIEHQSKIFSAAEIRHENNLRGYLYVILGGKIYDTIGSDIKNSQSRWLVVASLIIMSIVAITIGLVIFNLLTRHLQKITLKMQQFMQTELNGDISDSETTSQSPALVKDDMELLSQNFDRMASQIKQQMLLLRDADEMRRELIFNVSHDLRTPLATIQGYLESLLIKNSQLSEEQRLDYTKTAMKSTLRLGKLISDLFELSKLESLTIQPEFESFSLAELAYDVVQQLRLECELKGLTIEVRNDEEKSHVYADIGLIQRVFENLIRNAIIHTPIGGKITLHIHAPAQGNSGRLRISVMDNGYGIARENLPHIFERFYTNNTAHIKNENATGLGLAIVKRILELHQSEIHVDSELNQGTHFEFELPRQAA